jgi:hypothetical protein
MSFPGYRLASNVAVPRIHDLHSTFISNALTNGLTVFETARVAGTSVKMIERHIRSAARLNTGVAA